MRIGIDIMGGDRFPEAPIGGVASVLASVAPGTELVLIGDQPVIEAELARQGVDKARVYIHHADQIVGMDEHPAKAIQAKPTSSIVQGLGLVKAGQLDAFLSMGNTGAMTAGAVMLLGLLPGLARPTIGAFYPRGTTYSLLCDVGLNIDCKPDQLAQFGLLGSVFMQRVMGLEKPRVALLNVGEEPTKGTAAVQAAYKLMEAHPQLHFVGNAEGRDMQAGKADVYVCDGFTGNVVLKFAESLYHFMASKLQGDTEVEAFNFEAIGGLPLLGVKGAVLVGHGISGPQAYHNMVLRAEEVVRSQLVKNLEAAFEQQSASS